MNDSSYLSFVDSFFEVTNSLLVSKKKELALLFKPQLQYAQELTKLITDNFRVKLS